MQGFIPGLQAFSCTVKPDSESDLEMSSDVQWEYAPDKTFKRQILRKGSGLVCPRDGSVCKIRIAPSDSTSPNFILQRSIVLRENLDNLKEVVVGKHLVNLKQCFLESLWCHCSFRLQEKMIRNSTICSIKYWSI